MPRGHQNPYESAKQPGIDRTQNGSLGKYGLFSWLVAIVNVLMIFYVVGVSVYDVRFGNVWLRLISTLWCLIGVPVSSGIAISKCHRLRPASRFSLIVVNTLVLAMWCLMGAATIITARDL